MTSVPEIVEQIIRNSPFLQESIAEGVINFSALARKIKPEIEMLTGKEVQDGALIMALKRLEPKLESTNLEEDILDFIRHLGEVVIRTDLVDYAFKNSPSLMQKHQKFLQHIEGMSDVFHTSSKGVYETNVITSDRVTHLVEDSFQGEQVLSRIPELASVTTRMPTTYTKDVPGVFYYILRRLAWANINIVEIISTKHEFSLIIPRDSVNKTFNMINDLKDGKPKYLNGEV